MYLPTISRLQPFITRSHIMDSADLRWLETFGYDRDWETDSRRGDTEDPWNWSFPTVFSDPGDYEEPWDDIRRRERMAEAMYEC